MHKQRPLCTEAWKKMSVASVTVCYLTRKTRLKYRQMVGRSNWLFFFVINPLITTVPQSQLHILLKSKILVVKIVLSSYKFII